MVKYIIKRLLSLIPLFFIISIIIFTLVKCMPADPVNAYLGVGSNTSVKQKEHIREQLGLNESLPKQYTIWITNFIKGDLGQSIKYKQPVSYVINEYVWNTFLLNGVSIILALLIAIPVGVNQAIRKNTKYDSFWNIVSILGVSIPTFLFALLLIFLFAIPFDFIPLGGMHSTNATLFGYSNGLEALGDVILHMLLPVIVISFSLFSIFSKYIRNSMIDILNEQFIRTAKAKGLKFKVIVYSHAFKNCLIPLITLLGSYFPILFSGSLIVETIFLWPGIGKVLMDSITTQDQSMISACLMFTAILVLLGNLIADLLYYVVDPRMKEKRGIKYE